MFWLDIFRTRNHTETSFNHGSQPLVALCCEVANWKASFNAKSSIFARKWVAVRKTSLAACHLQAQNHIWKHMMLFALLRLKFFGRNGDRLQPSGEMVARCSQRTCENALRGVRCVKGRKHRWISNNIHYFNKILFTTMQRKTRKNKHFFSWLFKWSS